MSIGGEVDLPEGELKGGKHGERGGFGLGKMSLGLGDMSLGFGGKGGEHGEVDVHAGAHGDADLSLKGGKHGKHGDAELSIGGEVDLPEGELELKGGKHHHKHGEVDVSIGGEVDLPEGELKGGKHGERGGFGLGKMSLGLGDMSLGFGGKGGEHGEVRPSTTTAGAARRR